MTDPIKPSIDEIDVEHLEIKRIIPIHPEAKYMILCGPDVLQAEADQLAVRIKEWYSDPETPIAIVMGDISLVRVDKITDEALDIG